MIKTMGKPELGMGHIYRSLALAKELEKEFQVVLHVNDDLRVTALVHEHGANYFVDEDIESRATREKIDLLLMDQLSYDNGHFQKLKTRMPHLKVAALDYFDYENKFVDVIINLFNQNLQMPKPDRDDVRYYEGLEYAIIRQEFQNHISQERKASPKVSQVLVTFGGADTKGNTIRVIGLLAEAGIRGFKLDVVLGPLWHGELPAKSGLDIQVHHSVSALTMASLMTRADLAFCGSGTTMLELLAVGTPVVILPQNRWEMRFALSVEQKGAVRVIQSDVAQSHEVGYISDLFASFPARNEMSQRGKSLVDGKGTERIRRIISSILEKGG